MSKNMLTKNPFYILQANPRDTDRRLIEKALDIKLLSGEDTEDAQKKLLTPTGRLEAEIGFLPRMEEEQLMKLRESVENALQWEDSRSSGEKQWLFPPGTMDFHADSPLALLNGVNALLETWPLNDAPEAAAAALCIAGICSTACLDLVMRDLNEDRKEGERELLNDPGEVRIRLRHHMRSLAARLCDKFGRLPPDELDRLSELLADAYCDRSSQYHLLPVLDDMVSIYLGHRNTDRMVWAEKKIRDGMKQYADNFRKIPDSEFYRINSGNSIFAGSDPGQYEKVKKKQIIDELTGQLALWNQLTRPSRRITNAKGYTQKNSNDLFHRIHSFFVELHNEYRDYKNACRLILAIEDVFWDLQSSDREMVKAQAMQARKRMAVWEE